MFLSAVTRLETCSVQSSHEGICDKEMTNELCDEKMTDAACNVFCSREMFKMFTKSDIDVESFHNILFGIK